MSSRKLKLKSVRCLSPNRYLKWLLHTVDLLFSKIKTDFYNKANIFWGEYPTNQSSDTLKFCFSYISQSGPSVNLLYANFLSPSSDLTNVIWNFVKFYINMKILCLYLGLGKGRLQIYICKFAFTPYPHIKLDIVRTRWEVVWTSIVCLSLFLFSLPFSWNLKALNKMQIGKKKHLQISINSMWRVSFYL